MTQGTTSMPTYSDSIAVVSGEKQHYSTIQDAVESGAPSVRVHNYDTTKETFPITITEKIKVVADHQITLTPPEDTPAFVLTLGNERPPGAIIRGFRVNSGGIGFLIEGTKFSELRDCTVKNATNGVVIVDTDSHTTNSNKIRDCAITQTTGTAIETAAKSHSLVLDTVRVIDSGGYGLLANGPANLVIRGGQYEDCSESGIKLRLCESPVIRDCYIEGNARDYTDSNAGVTLADCVSPSVEGCYFNGKSETAVGVYAFGDTLKTEMGSFRGYETDFVFEQTT